MSVVLSILQWIGWILLATLAIAVLLSLTVMFVPVRYELEGDIRQQQWIKGKIHWLLHILRASVVYEEDVSFIEIKILWMSKTFSLKLEKENNIPQQAKKILNEEKKKEGIISKIKGIINRIKELYPKIKIIITDDRNKAAVLHIKRELIYLMKILLPAQSKIDATFSTGSPDTTGQAFGVIACLPIIYQEGWKLLPDFAAEEAYFHGYFWGKGRLYGYKLLGIILRIVFDKNCQRMYTMFNKFLKILKSNPSQEEK